jgi:hypothetical protein
MYGCVHYADCDPPSDPSSTPASPNIITSAGKRYREEDALPALRQRQLHEPLRHAQDEGAAQGRTLMTNSVFMPSVMRILDLQTPESRPH